MALSFYDNPAGPDADATAISVERVYCIHVDGFSQDQLNTLQSMFESLPGWVVSDDLSRWFRADEAVPPYLWASVEPAGLVVGGRLPHELWSTWDAQFRSAFERARLPSFDC